MDIKPIRTEADYDWAMAEVSQYFEREPAKDSPEADRFDVLSALIEAYEARNWPIEAPDPVDAIKYRMEIGDFRTQDLADVLGSRSRASEILNRRRALTLDMARRLHEAWGIPAEVLIRPYPLRAA